MNIGYKPLRDEILIELPVISDRTEAGVIKSDAVKEAEVKELKNQFFKVLAIGDKVQYIEVGDLVKIKGMHPVVINKVEYGQCVEHQVMGIKVYE